MGCDSESQQAKFITFFVFICQYFNTGFLILLSSANFKGQTATDGVLAHFFSQGTKTDFD
jgi:hypothetical protein